MTTLEHNLADLPSLRESLRDRLRAFAKRVRGQLVLEAIARWIAIIATAALGSFLLDRALRLSHLTRRGMLFALIALAVVELARRSIAITRLSLEPDVMAAALERKGSPRIAARIATVLESGTNDDSSDSMRQRAVIRSYESLSEVDFNRHFDERRRRNALAAIGGAIALWLAIGLVFPASSRLWAARMFAGSDQPWPQRTYLQIAGVADGRMKVPRGEAFALRVSARENSFVPDSIHVRWRPSGGARVGASLTRFADNDFRYDFPAIDSDTEVEITGGDDSPEPFIIHPIDRPKITDLKLITQHPTELNPTTHGFSGDDAGDLAFLPLTKMQLRFAANTPISQVQMKTATTQPAQSDLHRIDDRTFAIDWTQSAATQLQIELVGEEAGLTSVPTSVAIGLKTDHPPRATLGFTGVRQRVTAQATIPLTTEARDDFGVAKIDLNIRSEFLDPNDPKQAKSTATTRPVYGPSTQPILEKDVRQPQTLELPAMNLQPGHLLTLSATATDACYTGAQTASSRQISFRVVRPEELFREILLRQQSERTKFRKQLDEARKLRETMNQMSTSSPAAIARQHRAAQREVNRIESALRDSWTEMKLNVLATNEAYDLLEKNVLIPLRAFDQELLIPQRDALDSLKPENPNALAEVVARQDQIIDRMTQILKQMSQWDSFVDVLNQLNEVIRVQGAVEKGTNQLKHKQSDDVFDK